MEKLKIKKNEEKIFLTSLTYHLSDSHQHRLHVEHEIAHYKYNLAEHCTKGGASFVVHHIYHPYCALSSQIASNLGDFNTSNEQILCISSLYNDNLSQSESLIPSHFSLFSISLSSYQSFSLLIHLFSSMLIQWQGGLFRIKKIINLTNILRLSMLDSLVPFHYNR